MTIGVEQMNPQAQNLSGWSPLIIGIVCENSPLSVMSPAEADGAAYPDFRFLRVPCAGRINPQYVLRAFQQGADAVLLTGCPPGKCRYPGGDQEAKLRLELMREFIGNLGMEKERLQIKWTDAADSQDLRELVGRIAEKLENLGPNKLFKQPG
ncbi:hydrogenase iron-sulfur subunit [Desulfosporosinus sp. PR]|uniref:hydrogenase iron-sulfur subunit n=1 Tax=Candidatus Desulfosporosinus nitrosoreducens TaxID=3401928 RepID=UPI0027FECA8E|nr:hydrogenase iron-sulfur subunit [Desulfosporosinus sp. PR]MDQ7094733.1 hydrogenase iron-sulfur subunit [Desulfosporosinus sp. PR]